MSTVIEMPDQLDLPIANVEQPEDAAVCESLAESEPATVEVTEADVVADPTAPTATITDSVAEKLNVYVQYNVDPDILNEIWNAERDCRIAEAAVDELKARLKEAKGTYELAVLRLREISSRAGNGRGESAQSELATPMVSESKVTEGIGQGGTEGPVAESISSSDEWRAVPLADIGVASIKGLGKKKLEALLELCPTLGAFEDLRARVGQDAATLADLMPKGIGQEMCSALEELVLDWLAKRQARMAAAEELAATNPPLPPAHMGHEDQVSQRAKELDDGTPGCLDSRLKDGIWDSGYRAAENDASLWECPWTPGEAQDEWIRGWLGFHAVAKYEGKETQKQKTEAVDLDSL